MSLKVPPFVAAIIFQEKEYNVTPSEAEGNDRNSMRSSSL
jgi:hypothetical protein